MYVIKRYGRTIHTASSIVVAEGRRRACGHFRRETRARDWQRKVVYTNICTVWYTPYIIKQRVGGGTYFCYYPFLSGLLDLSRRSIIKSRGGDSYTK